MRWTVLVPLKALPAAKSRLVAASDDGASHLRLVAAIRHDTIAAASGAGVVARVVAVVDHAGVSDLPTFVQQTPGLNAALADAADWAAREWPDDAVAALVGDLPALRSDDLDGALGAAAHHPRAHVPDAQGTGTTLLTATPGTPLQPAFGPGSAARHRDAGAVPIEAGAGLRADVDTAADLAATLALGVGPATAAVIAARRSPAVHLDAS